MTKIGLVCLFLITFLGAQEYSLAEHERRCDKGNGDSCATLGAVYAGLGSSRIPKDIVKAKAYWKKGCELNSGSACTTYAMVLEDEEEMLSVLKKACTLGNENGCLTYRGIVKNKKLKEECIKGSIKSCTALAGEIFLAGDYDNSIGLLDLSCEEGSKEACEDVSTIRHITEHTMLDLHFMKPYIDDCNMNKNKIACERVGTFYVQVNQIYQDMAKEDEKKKVAYMVMENMVLGQLYLEKACELGRNESCRTVKKLKKMMHR